MFNPSTQSSNKESCYGDWGGEGGVQFRPNYTHEALGSDDHSGFSSPPLWRNSPSPPKSPSHPLLGRHNYHSLSPNSRTQAIARGQWELMEMVKNMPESSYELSLKDLVEHHRTETPAPQPGGRPLNNNRSLHQRGGVRVKGQESKKTDRNVMRSGSFENRGLFLNLVFPFSLKSKKKKKLAGNNTSGKVSPKPEGLKGGGAEKDWWTKRFTGSSDSDSSRTTNNSGGSGSTGSSGGGGGSRSSDSGRRKRSGLLTGCWPLFQSRKSKSVE